MYGVTETMDNPVSTAEDRICKIIFLEKTFPSWYLKECDENGKIPTEKEGGVAWKAGIIAELTNGEWESFKKDDIEVVELSFPTPQTIYEKNIGMGHITKCGKAKLKEGGKQLVMMENGGDRIVWENIVPSTYPVKDFKSGMTADKIKPDEEKKYADLLANEQKRQRIWGTILQYWNTVTEEQAIADNEAYISRRLLMYHRDGEGDLVYIPPTKGIVITVKLKGKYKEPVAMEWDNEARSNIYYSKGVEGIETLAADEINNKVLEGEEVPF